MIWDNCLSHKFSKFIYQKENFIELSQPHITYQKANNIVLTFVVEDAQNTDLLKSALRNHLRTIQHLYSLLFPKIYSRTNRFGINNKLHFDFIFTNWRHDKSNLVLPTPIKNKDVEQPIKNIIPEIDITQQKQQQQQQQQQQNEKEKEEILWAGKRPESYEKRVAHPFEQKPEKNNEVLTPTTTPSPKIFGNTYPFEQKSEKILKQRQHYHRLLLSQPQLIYHKLNLLYQKQNQYGCKSCKKRAVKRKH